MQTLKTCLWPAGRHPFTWVVWFTALVMTAMFAFTAWRLLPSGGTAAAFGWTEAPVEGRWYVRSIGATSPAGGRLQIGDRLISLNGDTNVARAGTAFYRRDLGVGESYRLRIERNADEHEYLLAVGTVTSPLGDRLVWFFESLVWCAVALFVGFARPEQPVARLTFIGAAITGIFFLENRIFPLSLRPIPIRPFHVVLGYHFFYRFPGGVPSGKVWTIILWLLYVGAAVATSLQQWLEFTYLTQGAAGSTQLVADHAAVFSWRVSLANLVFSVAVVAMVAVIARNYYVLTDFDQRRRIRWVAYASVLGLAPLLWLSAVMLYRLFGGTGWLPAISNLAIDVSTTAIPVSVAYVVVKHRIFDIKVVLRRGIQYLFARRALQTLLALPALALVFTVVTSRNQTIAELVTGTTGYLYWIAAAGLSLKFRQPLRVWLDRKFFREQYDREQVMENLLDDLGKLDSISEVSRLASAQLEFALHPKAIYLWYRNVQRVTLVYSSKEVPMRSEFPSERLLSFIEKEDAIVDVSSSITGLSEEEAKWLSSLQAHLIVPILGGSGRLAGVLMLGEKKSEEPYSTRDRRLLLSIAKQMAVVRENLELKARVGEEQRIRYEVLARLDERLINLMKECPSCGVCFDSAAEHCDRDGARLTLSLPVERTIDGKYRLEHLIGKGGMGAVYDARDLRLDRTVAVKIMIGHSFGDDQALRRFQREARAAAKLDHPRIVSVYDFGPLEGEGAYLVMERVYGQTLRTELNRAGVLAPAIAADLFDQLLDGVAAAHAHNIVHRDLKPENVVGQWSDPNTLGVKILDFGLAKFGPMEAAAGTTITATGAVMGTFGYIAPEQLLGPNVDHRADIFALGVMLAEVITGRKPFQGESYSELLRAVMLDTYRLPGSSPEILALDAVLQRCLAKEPQDRMDSASELRDELIPLLRACPPLPAPGRHGGSPDLASGKTVT